MLHASFGPKGNDDVACMLSRRQWNRPGIQPNTGQKASTDATRWQTAPKPSPSRGKCEEKFDAYAASFGLQKHCSKLNHAARK